jgi:hypothetical protein
MLFRGRPHPGSNRMVYLPFTEIQLKVGAVTAKKRRAARLDSTCAGSAISSAVPTENSF